MRIVDIFFRFLQCNVTTFFINDQTLLAPITSIFESEQFYYISSMEFQSHDLDFLFLIFQQNFLQSKFDLMAQNDKFHVNSTCVGGFIENQLVAQRYFVYERLESHFDWADYH